MGQHHSAPSKPVAKEPEVQSFHQGSSPSNEVYENKDTVISSSTARNSEVGGRDVMLLETKPPAAGAAPSMKEPTLHKRTHTEITHEEEDNHLTSHQQNTQPKQQQQTIDPSLQRHPSPAVVQKPKSPETTTPATFPSLSSFDKSKFVQANKEVDGSADHVFYTSQGTLPDGAREAEFKFLDEDDLCMMDDILREVL
ncbi:hypothetical protein HDU81_007544 [Chytriomyces hyalinus]|nr:hypothetical protein HDU81_007544 [Chytriomyces hyalinus]